MKIGSIVFRCYEFDKMFAFWQEALHYIPREPATDACMSRRDRFDHCNLQQLVHTHAKVIANDCVYLSLSTFLQGLAREDLQELAQSARAPRVQGRVLLSPRSAGA